MDQCYYYLYNNRFLPYTEDNSTLCIFDFLHMKMQTFVIQWDSEPITSKNTTNIKERDMRCTHIRLADLHTVIARTEVRTNGKWMTGFDVFHLDYESSIATLKRPFIPLSVDGYPDPCWFKITDNGFESIFLYDDDFLKKFTVYKISNLYDCDFKQRAQHIDFPKPLHVITLVDNKFYGFWQEDRRRSDYSKLIQVCLDTKEVTTLKVSGWSTNQQYNPNTYEEIWIGRTFVKKFDSYDRTLDHFFAFSLDSLQWRKLNIAFKCRGGRHLLSNNENTLVVKTVSCANKLTSFYRFNFNRPDTLVNLSRYAIKQDSSIFQDVVEHLPNKFKQPFTE